MTLRQLRRVALKYAPRRARFPKKWWFRDRAWPWVPAHELGHAFVAEPEQLTQRRYGLCRAFECKCPNRSCHVYETAAMLLSGAWVVACGRPDVMAKERTEEATPCVDELMSQNMQARARRRLRRLGLWPIPITIEDIEAFAVKKGLSA